MDRRLRAALLSLPLLLVGALPAPLAALPPVAHPDGYAGACYTFYPNDPGHPYLLPIYNAGARWDRFDFHWPNIEPSNNQWQFGAYDRLVDDLRAAGMDIVGILLWTPDWAATRGMYLAQPPGLDGRPFGWYAPVPGAALAPRAITAASSPPAGLDLPWDNPNNHWGNYVYTVVSRYSQRGVRAWEMWNEPEWDYFWTGTDVQYARLLTVGYQATKAACPDCTVLFAGLHYWADPTFYERVLDILNDNPEAPANNYYFDVMSVHLYSRSSSIYDVISQIRSRMRTLTSDHPVWLTETGVPVWDDATVDPDPTPYQWSARQSEAAAFVIQSYANARAVGVQRYFFFRTNDADMGEYFGLIRNNGTLRPAYTAYQVATTYLVSPAMVTSVNYSSVRRVTLWGTPWGKVSVLWNTTPTTVSFGYPATLPTATRVDRMGNTQTLTAANGVYTLSLAAATANQGITVTDYIIGGDPYLVIEADTVPPTATVHPLPDYTPPPTIAVSWSGADDAAGIWRYDVQVRRGLSGTWNTWQNFTAATSAPYTNAQSGEVYCFRARAWDRAGNRGEWPADAQACTQMGRWLHLEVPAVFGDENENGLLDAEEVTVTATLRLVDSGGADVVTPTVGASWNITVPLSLGSYTLTATPVGWPAPPPGWLPRRDSLTVTTGVGIQEVSLPVGLLPHRVSLILPVVSRQGT